MFIGYMHLNKVGGSADGGSVDSVDHGFRVVGLPVGEDPGVGAMEDDGQAPPDVAGSYSCHLRNKIWNSFQ